MAFSAGVITGVLELRDRMSQQLRQATTVLGTFGTSARDMGTRLDNAGVAMQNAAGALAPLSLAVTGLGVASARAFMDFEQGMNRVEAVTGATEAQMQSMTTVAQDLGATTAFSATQAAEGMGFLAMAGFDVNQIMGAMPNVLTLAASAGLQLGDAADITTNILTGFGLEVGELEAANDALVVAFTSANTNLSQLGQAFKFVGPVAKSAGLDFNQTGAALALMGNAGIQASMAGTGLRGAITRLLNPTAQIREEMLRLGLNATDTHGRLLPLDQIVQQLEPHADNAGAMMRIFGQRAGPAMAALVGQGADALRDLTAQMGAAEGTAQRIADTQMQGAIGAFIEFKSAVEGLFIAIGERLPLVEFIDAATDLVRLLRTEVLPAFDRMPPSIQGFVLAISGITAVLTPLVFGTGALLRLAGVALSGFGTAAGAAASAAGTGAAAAGGMGLAAVLGVLTSTVTVGLGTYRLLAPVWDAATAAGLAARDVFFDLTGKVDTLTHDSQEQRDAVAEAAHAMRNAESDARLLGPAMDAVSAEALFMATQMEEVKEVTIEVEEAFDLARAQGVIPLDTSITVLDADLLGFKLTLDSTRISTDNLLQGFLNITAEGIIPMRDGLVGPGGVISSIGLTQVSMEDLDGLVNNGFFDQLLTDLGGPNGVAQTFIRSFTGGGGALGAVKAFSTQALSNLLGMIPGVGAFASQFAGLIVGSIGTIGRALGRLGSAFGDLLGIGRSTSDNIVLTFERHWGVDIPRSIADGMADISDQFDHDWGAIIFMLADAFETMGIEAVGGMTVAAGMARDTFSAIELGWIDTERGAQAFNDQIVFLAQNFDDADAAGQAAFFELIQLAEQFGFDIEHLRDLIGDDLVDQALNTDLSDAIRDSNDKIIGWSDTATTAVKDIGKEFDAATSKVQQVKDVWTSIDFRVPTIDVDFNFDTSGKPSGFVPSFQHGTGGRFVDFGAGTLAMLHGRERVVTEHEGIEGDNAAVIASLGRIERALKRMPKTFASQQAIRG